MRLYKRGWGLKPSTKYQMALIYWYFWGATILAMPWGWPLLAVGAVLLILGALIAFWAEPDWEIPMRLYRRSKEANWTLDVSHGGERHVKSTGTINKAEANAWAREYIAKLETGVGYLTREPHVTFHRLCELAETHYQVEGRRSLKSLKLVIKRLERTFDGVRATDITTERIERYKADRLVENAAKATINLELSALSLMFRLATEQRLVSARPIIRNLNASDNVRQGFVSQGDYLAIRAHLTERYADLTDYLWWTGQRIGAARQLQWRDISLGEGPSRAAEKAVAHADPTAGGPSLGIIRIRGETTKTGSVHEIPLVAELAEVIRRAAAYRTLICPYVFHWDAEHPISRTRAEEVWKIAATKAGLGHILFHDLRRSFVRNMLLAGMPFATIKLFTGHQSDAILSRYAIMTTEDQAHALQRLSEYLAGQSTEPSVRKIR